MPKRSQADDDASEAPPPKTKKTLKKANGESRSKGPTICDLLKPLLNRDSENPKLGQLRSMWELPASCHLCWCLHEVLNMTDFDPPDIERAFLAPQESELLNEIFTKFLMEDTDAAARVPKGRGFPFHLWTEELQRVVQEVTDVVNAAPEIEVKKVRATWKTREAIDRENQERAARNEEDDDDEEGDEETGAAEANAHGSGGVKDTGSDDDETNAGQDRSAGNDTAVAEKEGGAGSDEASADKQEGTRSEGAPATAGDEASATTVQPRPYLMMWDFLKDDEGVMANPLANAQFHELPIEIQLQLFSGLAHYRMEYSLRSTFSNAVWTVDCESSGVEPFWTDSDGNLYYIFPDDGMRIYLASKPMQGGNSWADWDGPAQRDFELEQRDHRAGKYILPLPPQEPQHFQLLFHEGSMEDLRHFIDGLSKAAHKSDRELAEELEYILENMEVIKQQKEEWEEEQSRKVVVEQSRKRSTRKSRRESDTPELFDLDDKTYKRVQEDKLLEAIHKAATNRRLGIRDEHDISLGKVNRDKEKLRLEKEREEAVQRREADEKASVEADARKAREADRAHRAALREQGLSVALAAQLEEQAEIDRQEAEKRARKEAALEAQKARKEAALEAQREKQRQKEEAKTEKERAKKEKERAKKEKMKQEAEEFESRLHEDEDGEVFYEAADEETPRYIARMANVTLDLLLQYNQPRLPELTANLPLEEGTELGIPPDGWAAKPVNGGRGERRERRERTDYELVDNASAFEEQLSNLPAKRATRGRMPGSLLEEAEPEPLPSKRASKGRVAGSMAEDGDEELWGATARQGSAGRQARGSEQHGRSLGRSIPLTIGNLHDDCEDEDGEPMHRWTLFVRGEDAVQSSSDLGIKKLTVRLHKDFQPPTVRLNAPPWEITRVGWGEFEALITIHLKDGRTVETSHMLDFSQEMSFEPSEIPEAPKAAPAVQKQSRSSSRGRHREEQWLDEDRDGNDFEDTDDDPEYEAILRSSRKRARQQRTPPEEDARMEGYRGGVSMNQQHSGHRGQYEEASEDDLNDDDNKGHQYGEHTAVNRHAQQSAMRQQQQQQSYYQEDQRKIELAFGHQGISNRLPTSNRSTQQQSINTASQKEEVEEEAEEAQCGMQPVSAGLDALLSILTD